MINKQSLWFLTLFSLILVLSVYYITMPNELLLTNNSNYLETEETSGEQDDIEVTIEESEVLVTMRVNLEEERNMMIADLRSTLTSEETTSEEKNNAYEQIKYITDLTGQEEKLEQKLKKNFNLQTFIKMDNNEIKVIAIGKTHDTVLANNIMKSIQEEFDNKVYVTVKFEN